MLNPQPVRPYQFSLLTSREPQAVLDDVAARPLPGIRVAERGSSYVILRPITKRRWGGQAAAIMGVVILVTVLALAALTPLFLILLPFALAPGIPFLVDHQADIAISAIEEGPDTRVTVHGQASSQLAAALDAFVSSLPHDRKRILSS